MKNILKAYNQKDTLLVITSYPNPVNGKYGKRDFNAIGEHSERRLPYLAKNRKVLVAAEDLGTTKYFEPQNNIAIARTWKKGDLLSILKLAKFILQFDKIKSVLVQFEFNVLGGIKANLILLMVLMLLKLRGKRVTFEMHQVLTDIGSVKRHININNPIMQQIYNLGLKIFYLVTGLVTDKIIVFEEEMKLRLKKYVPASKIEVLCLSVDKQKVIAIKEARAQLGVKQDEFVLLVFGFINGYKGIDWILNALKGMEGLPAGRQGKKVRLIIAGGKNPYLINKPFYQKFYNSIVAQTQKYAHVTYTDFVPEDKVSLYYSACDLVVMPYIAFMSASGPFSRALAHEKPIIISEKLADYAKTADFVQSFNSAGLKKEDVVFELNKRSLLSHIEKAQTNPAYLKGLGEFSKALAKARNIENVSRSLDNILFEKQTITTQRSLLFELVENGNSVMHNFSMRAIALTRRINA
ncbi:MAG TPA: glycosyltransferase [Xanthomonadales bacterium]|nr:glycosyltransferase [Xanthomonadales bacterium]